MVLTKDEIVSYLSATPPLIENIIDVDTQIQPNGFDLTLLSVSKFDGEGCIDFSNKNRVLPNLIPIDFDSNGWIKLLQGCYIITFNEIVNLPNDITAIGRPRSSILRMGATIQTAVWDAGYCGRSQSLLVVFNESGIRISKNARVLQLVFIRLSKDTNGYKGIYQGENMF